MRLTYYSVLLLSGLLLIACGEKKPDTAPTNPTTTSTTDTTTTTPNTATTTSTTPATPAATSTSPSEVLPSIASEPVLAGSGCAAGSAKVEFQAGQSSFTLTLQPMTLKQGRITCNLAIPVTVPNGYQVALLPLRFTGTLQGNGAELTLHRTYFTAGDIGTPQINTLTAKDSPFTVADSFADEQQWAKCGEDVNLRVNMSAMLQGNGQGTITLNSTDPDNPTVFKLNYRKC